MTNTNTLSCPSCNSPILYDVYGLLAGKKFVCPNCSLVISLAAESKNVVQNAVDKYEQLEKSKGNN